jgi:hypothetical protein
VQNIRRRSKDSAYETLRRFGRIDKRFHKPPKYFSRMTTKRAKKFLLDMIEDFETNGGEDGASWLEVESRITSSQLNDG